jgi:hypothetical protein
MGTALNLIRASYERAQPCSDRAFLAVVYKKVLERREEQIRLVRTARWMAMVSTAKGKANTMKFIVENFEDITETLYQDIRPSLNAALKDRDGISGCDLSRRFLIQLMGEEVSDDDAYRDVIPFLKQADTVLQLGSAGLSPKLP